MMTLPMSQHVASARIAPCAHPHGHAHKRSVACNAANKHPQVQKPLKVDPNAKKRGFKWDPANSRWIRDDRVADTAWENNTTVQPLTGPAYTVWPVMHSLLMDSNLQSLTPEEVRIAQIHAVRIDTH